MQMVYRWVTIFLLFLHSLPLLSQESVLTASDNATGTGGMVSYSIGQVAFRTVETGSGAVTEGVQQPYEILFMTGLEDEKSISLHCIVYPNPANSEVRLKIDRSSIEQLSCQLRNNNGLIVSEMKIESREVMIPVKDLPAGAYMLTILENNINLKTWKVIKK